MLNENIADRMWIILASIYLFVNRPSQWFSKLSADLTYSRHSLCPISSIVRKYDADEVLISQHLQIVEYLFDELLLMSIMRSFRG